MRTAISEAPPQPEPPALVAFPGGVIQCPMCDRTFGSGPGLMRHLTTIHAGASLDAEAVRVLRALGRAVCSDSSCNGIRRIGMVSCNRCHRSTSLRPLIEGDVVPGPRTGNAPAPTTGASTADLATANARRSARREDVDLSANFTSRVRMLHGATQTHIPIALRARHAKIWAETLEGMAANSPGWTSLEEARSKLLLLDPPPGKHIPTELEERVVLWQQGQYEELLCRAEAQAALRRTPPKRNIQKKAEAVLASKKRRAKRLCGEGAYRKAVQTMTGEHCQMAAAEEARWAAELIPRSEAPARALSGMEIE